MSEFIGSRISLISKSDIRYVGTLHEINSENSTVALEQVSSFGTEGRRKDTNEEIPPSDNVYEYIVFRGSDVKDLRIEQAPTENKPPPPQMPNDPAILGTGARPSNHNRPPVQGQQQQQPQGSDGFRSQLPSFQQPPHFQYNSYNQYPPQRFGGPPGQQQNFGGRPGGFQGPPGMMPFNGPPPGWYPPPGHGFDQPPPPPPFSPPPPHMPFNSAGPSVAPPQQSQLPDQQQQRQPYRPQQQPSLQQEPKPNTELPNMDMKTLDTSSENKTILQRPNTQTRASAKKPGAGLEEMTASSGSATSNLEVQDPASSSAKTNSSAVKSGRIVPAVPLASPVNRSIVRPIASFTPPVAPPATSPLTTEKPSAGNTTQQHQTSTEMAAAAVAAAMAKLPRGPLLSKKGDEEGNAMDNLTRKVNEMRTKDRSQQQRNATPSARGDRSRGRGGRGGPRESAKPVQVPTTEFDFASSNARFNKDEVSKEAAVGPTVVEGTITSTDGADAARSPASDVVIPAAPGYTKSSFFDNLSSEAQDRDGRPGAEARRPSGSEFRIDERRRNMETFGLGSVDGGYRGGRGGRGRGRGGLRRRGDSRGGVQGGDSMRGRGSQPIQPSMQA